MTTLREAAQQALEALENAEEDGNCEYGATAALRAALAQQEQEPVAWIQPDHLQKARQAPFLCRVEPTKRMSDFVPFYTHPPRREWVSLTEEEIQSVIQLEREKRFQRRPPLPLSMTELSHAIEQACKERNT